MLREKEGKKKILLINSDARYFFRDYVILNRVIMYFPFPYNKIIDMLIVDIPSSSKFWNLYLIIYFLFNFMKNQKIYIRKYTIRC